MFGFLNINKPQGGTSRDAVNVVQRLVRPSKVGHAGTLDPLATGVLVIGLGPATRLVQYVQRMPKTYVADFRLGFESDTEDILGDVSPVANSPVITREAIDSVLPNFVGKILQRPPIYSALKINGKRAYQLAREGKSVELSPRPIIIHQLRMISFEYPDFQLEIECGSGTYVRSLGRDIASELGTGAIMTQLVRTAIGNFKVSEGISLDDLNLETISGNLIAPQKGLDDLRSVKIPNDQLPKFANGCPWCPERAVEDDEVMAIDESDRLIAILKKREPRLLTPHLNFSNYWADHRS